MIVIREKGNVVSQVWVIPNHVNRTERVQPLPERTTWSEHPYRKKKRGGGRFLLLICSLLTEKKTELRKSVSFSQGHTGGKS